MQNEVKIRRTSTADAVIIAAFNQAMALETEGKHLNDATIQAGVLNLIQNPAYGFYLVAEVDGVIAACLLITYEWSDWRNGLFWWIQSVYVAPSFRHQGIYKQMYSYVKKLAKQKGEVCGLRLYVDRDNHIAQLTYLNLGMTATNYLLYEELFSESLP